MASLKLDPKSNHVIPISIQSSLREVEKHAREFPDQEVCGAIIDGKVVRGRNVIEGEANIEDGTVSGALVPANSLRFRLDHKTASELVFAALEGKTAIMYHSHCREESCTDFSPEDMEHMTVKGDIPWLLINVSKPQTRFSYFDPAADLDYVGREWRWSCSNCYTLVREWVRRELGVRMRPYHLQSPIAWENPEWNRFQDNLESEGFQVVCRPPHIKDLQRGDLILFRIGRNTRNPNHIAVLTNPNTNTMLHHLEGSLSTTATYEPSRRKSTVAVYRHESLIRSK